MTDQPVRQSGNIQPGGGGSQGTPSSQAPLSENDVRAVADRVYQMLLEDLAAERQRRGGRQ